MNGNVVGEPFEKYVADQIKNRQKLHGGGLNSSRGNTNINYLNNRNAWIKLASSVLVENTSVLPGETPKVNGVQRLVDLGIPNPEEYMDDNLAKSFILFNGTQALNSNNTSYTVREGIAKSKSALESFSSPTAYGLGGSNQGIQPMPGIESVSVDCINRGSIRKATVELKVYNKTQFHIIELLYLRLGFTMILEWGWDKYLHQDENGNVEVKDVGNTLIENFWFNDLTCEGVVQSEIIKKIEKEREKYQGNYDGFYGRVVNYSWDFNKDGSYNITLDLITIGDVIESLKINTSSNLNIKINDNKGSDGKKNELKGKFEGFDDSKIIDVAGSNKIGEFLYNQIKNYQGITGDFIKLDSSFGNLDQYSFLGFQWGFDYAKFTEKPQYKYYIRFGRLMEFLETQILPIIQTTNENKNEAILQIENSLNLKYKKYPNQISIDPRICLITPNIKGYEFDNLEIGEVKDKNGNNANLLELFHLILVGGRTDESSQRGIGVIPFIYLNFEFVAEQLSKNLDKEQNLSLYKFLEGICDGINRALGTVNKIQPIIDKDKKITFIDESLSFEEVYPEEIKKKEEVNLEIYGYNLNNNTSNFVKDISFKTKLGPEIASIISIGATAEGNTTKTVDGTSFSKWNDGLKDKFNLAITSPSSGEELTDAEERKKKEERLGDIFDTNSSIVPSENNISRLFSAKLNSIFTNITTGANTTAKDFQNSFGVTHIVPYQNIDFEVTSRDQFIKEAIKYDETFKASNGVTKDENGNFINVPSWDFYLANSFGGKVNNTIYQEGKSKGNRIIDEDIRYFELNDSFISNGIQLYKEYIKNYYQQIYNKIEQPSNTIGFIPVTFDITTEGLSGVKIYQKLNIRQEFLPPQYPKALKFLITKVNHEISNNNWDTKLSTMTTSNINHEEVVKYEKEFLNNPSQIPSFSPSIYSEEDKDRVDPQLLKVDIRGLGEIKKWESFRSKAYDDLDSNKILKENTIIRGTLTVGYGFTKNVLPDIKWNTTLTEPQAASILSEKIEIFENIVRNQIKVKLTQNEFNALVSIVYNSGELGNTSSGKPTPLLDLINQEKYFEASGIIPQYRITSEGKILNGLINRRTSEKELFLSNEFRV